MVIKHANQNRLINSCGNGTTLSAIGSVPSMLRRIKNYNEDWLNNKKMKPLRIPDDSITFEQKENK